MPHSSWKTGLLPQILEKYESPGLVRTFTVTPPARAVSAKICAHSSIPTAADEEFSSTRRSLWPAAFSSDLA
jgi:hypothetical protein